MADIQIWIPDSDDEGEWRDIDESQLDLSEHDAEIRADAIEEFKDKIVLGIKNGAFDTADELHEFVVDIAELLKEQK